MQYVTFSRKIVKYTLLHVMVKRSKWKEMVRNWDSTYTAIRTSCFRTKGGISFLDHISLINFPISVSRGTRKKGGISDFIFSTA